MHPGCQNDIPSISYEYLRVFIKKKLFGKDVLQRKVNAMLNLRSAEIKTYNNSKSI